MYQPFEVVAKQYVRDIYLDFFKKNIKASDTIRYVSGVVKNFPEESPTKILMKLIKVL